MNEKSKVHIRMRVNYPTLMQSAELHYNKKICRNLKTLAIKEPSPVWKAVLACGLRAPNITTFILLRKQADAMLNRQYVR